MIKIVSRLESFSEGEEDVLREVHRAFRLEQQGAEVSLAFTVTFGDGSSVQGYSGLSKGQVGLFRDHGIRPILFMIELRKAKSLEGAIKELVRRRLGFLPKEPITRIELHMFPTP